MIDAPDDAVFCLGDKVGFIALVDSMKVDHAKKVVNSARISYDKSCDKFSEKDKILTKFLWEEGHSSPYRHSYYTFHWKAPLFVFRQAFKYQVGSGWREYEVNNESVSLQAFDYFFDTDKSCSWNEISGRYIKWSPEFYIPQKMRANPGHADKQASIELPDEFEHEDERIRMQSECDTMFDMYRQRLARGVAKEIARMCLPQNLYSQAYWTVSLQGLIHFLEQRMAPHAQYETKCYAQAIYKMISKDLELLGITYE